MKYLFLVSFALVLVAASAANAADKKTLAKGKEVFLQNCVTCHGTNGEGDGPAAVALNPKPRNFVKDEFKAGSKPEQIFKTVTDGLPGTLMVSYKHLPEADRKAVAAYVAQMHQGSKPKGKK